MSLTWSLPDSAAPGNQTYGIPRRSAYRICLPNLAGLGATSHPIPRARSAVATRVEIGLGEGDGEFRLVVDDDGRGGAHEVETGMGIANMRTRAAQLPGGRFALGNGTDGGTSVSVCWRAL